MIVKLNIPTIIIADNHEFRSSYTKTVSGKETLLHGNPIAVITPTPPSEWTTFIPMDVGAEIISMEIRSGETSMIINVKNNDFGRTLHHMISARTYTIEAVCATNEPNMIRGFYMHENK